MIKKIQNLYYKITNLNINDTDSPESQKNKYRFNVICLNVSLIALCMIIIYYFVFGEEIIMLSANICIIIYLIICFVIVNIFPYTIDFVKKTIIPYAAIAIFIETILVGGYSFGSTEITIVIYLIILAALLDTSYVSAIFSGIIITIFHAILYNINPYILPDLLSKYNIPIINRGEDVFIMPFIFIAYSLMMVAMKKSNDRYRKQISEKNKKTEQELELARETIEDAFYKIPKWLSNYDYKIYQDFYYKIGGDFFYFDEKYNYFFLVDICGHGINAAILVLWLKCELERSITDNLENTVNTFYNRINRRIKQLEKQCTITAIEFMKNDKIKYINFGNFIAKHNKTGHEILNTHGSFIKNKNIYSFANINDYKLIIASDGIIENTDKNNKEFGKERIIKSMTNKIEKSMTNLIYNFKNYIIEIQDDITVIILRGKK